MRARKAVDIRLDKDDDASTGACAGAAFDDCAAEAAADVTAQDDAEEMRAVAGSRELDNICTTIGCTARRSSLPSGERSPGRSVRVFTSNSPHPSDNIYK